jgi:CubicO group peptidase (beta-lactamase class C family)
MDPVDRARMLGLMRENKVPGASVAVIDAGQVVWSQSYGVRGAGSDAKVDGSTLFQAASVSKSIAAIIAMILAGKGKLDLDKDVNAILRRWKLRGAHGRVTTRLLLEHAGGVNVPSFGGYPRGGRLPTLPQILEGSPPAKNPPIRVTGNPGTYAYSGGGYEVVEKILEEASGHPFPRLAHDTLFAPLKMAHSTFVVPLTDAKSHNVAAGHDSRGRKIAKGWVNYPQLAAAGLWTTAADLALALADVLNAGRGKGRVLATNDAQTMTVPAKLSGGGNALVGFAIKGSGANMRIVKGGSNYGYRAHIEGFPATANGFVVVANSDNGSKLNAAIFDMVAAARGWPAHGQSAKKNASSDPTSDPPSEDQDAGQNAATYDDKAQEDDPGNTADSTHDSESSDSDGALSDIGAIPWAPD